jgi:hypothetical protein
VVASLSRLDMHNEASMSIIAPPAVVDRAALARILEQSIPYVVKDEFHPVLYEAMSGLHQYVGVHLSRLKPQQLPRPQEERNGRSPVMDHHHEVNDNYSKPAATPTTTTTVKLNQHKAAIGGGLKHLAECAIPSLSKTNVPSPPPPPLLAVKNASSAKEPTLQSSNDTVKREKQNRWFGTLKKEKPAEQKNDVTTEQTNKPNSTGTVDEPARKEKLQQVKANTDKHEKLQTEPSRQASKSMAEQISVNNQQLQDARANAVKKETPLVVQSTSRHPHAIPSTAENLPVEVRLEQEKRQAAERHRRDVELQRKLSRAEWKTDDLAQKLKYLANEERKLTLVVSSQQQPGSVAAANATESLRQTETQMASIQKQLQEQETVVAEIKAELLQQHHHHHHQEETVPLDDSQSAREIAVEQKRRHEAHRKLETDLEVRKKAAAEQRRKELEEERQRGRLEQKKLEEEKKRQFLEQEQRKQDLMNSAKLAHGHKKPTVGEDNALLEKLSNQVSAFDHADIHRSESCVDDAVEGITSSPQGGSAANNDPVWSDKVPAMNNPPASHHHQREAPIAESTANNFHNPGTAHASPKQNPPRSTSFQSTDHEPNGPSRQPPPPQHHHHHHPSGTVDQNYTQTSKQQQQEEEDAGIDESSTMAELKRGILLSWALQPPNMQTLRPIGELLTTIHHAFPPAHDLPRHDYFDDWQPLLLGVPTTAMASDEQQLNKAVRKIRFFLHPDKRPRDLSEQHQYLCQLLWDVINDAWEEYLRVKDELGWMND